jgi:hypothetical protein
VGRRGHLRARSTAPIPTSVCWDSRAHRRELLLLLVLGMIQDSLLELGERVVTGSSPGPGPLPDIEMLDRAEPACNSRAPHGYLFTYLMRWRCRWRFHADVFTLADRFPGPG